MNTQILLRGLLLPCAVALTLMATADISGGYMASDATSMAFLSLTQTKDNVEGTWQYVGEDRKEPNWYKAYSVHVSGDVDGQKFTLRMANGTLLQGKTTGSGIQVRIATLSGESVSLSLYHATDATWNSVVQKFKKAKSSSALANRFGTALENRVTWLKGEKAKLDNELDFQQEKKTDTISKIKQSENDKTNAENKLKEAEDTLRDAQEALELASAEETRAGIEESRNNTPETREIATKARRAASIARTMRYRANTDWEISTESVKRIKGKLKSLYHKVSEITISVQKSLKRVAGFNKELDVLNEPSSINQIASLRSGDYSKLKLIKASDIYGHPSLSKSDLLFHNVSMECITIQTGQNWYPTLLSSGILGWVSTQPCFRENIPH